jgi:hypothetical protein
LFQELKTSNIGRLNNIKVSEKESEFQLKDYLNLKNSILGLMIPLQFKTYVNFDKNCHEYYEILIGTQLYRQKVGLYYETKSQSSQPIEDELL